MSEKARNSVPTVQQIFSSFPGEIRQNERFYLFTAVSLAVGNVGHLCSSLFRKESSVVVYQLESERISGYKYNIYISNHI